MVKTCQTKVVILKLKFLEPVWIKKITVKQKESYCII